MTDWKDALRALTDATPEEERTMPKETHKGNRTGVVYSTNPHFTYEEEGADEPDTMPKQLQKLRLSIERAGRGGKTVTLMKGFIGRMEDAEALCKLLKQKCGVGGSVKDGEIIIQGNHRERLLEILRKEGYSQAK